MTLFNMIAEIRTEDKYYIRKRYNALNKKDDKLNVSSSILLKNTNLLSHYLRKFVVGKVYYNCVLIIY